MPDTALVGAIRAVLAGSGFHGEGCRKVWARLRFEGIRTSRRRVLRSMNLMLDVLDQELARRGHRFVRYAEDGNIYVRSHRAGERVMASVTRYVTTRLKLRVKASKSTLDQPSHRQFLGFSFTPGKGPPRRRIASQVHRTALPFDGFKERVRERTRRAGGISLVQRIEGVRVYLTGWLGYFGFCQTPTVLRMLEQWIRRRLRAVAWRQWRNG